jgi:NAD(P)-dependent dehydrogenase (short-subunit alcohol dehydrogenase family)
MHPEIVSMFDLGGKVALIIGGAVNLGFDAACVLAAAGANVAITSRQRERAGASAENLKQRYGVETLALPLDHTDSGQVDGAVAQALAWKGRIDVLVNNAGGGSGNRTGNLFLREPDDIARVIQVNLTGTLYCARAVGRLMAAQGGGKIINLGSIAGIVGRDRRMYDRSDMNGQPVEYAAAKAGVIGMTRDLAGFLSPKGVYVNCISPGGFARNLPETFMHDYSDRTPLGRMGRDGIDLKGAILFLASSASDYVTGHNLVVDGGFSAWQ